MRIILAITTIVLFFTACQNAPKPVKEEKSNDYSEAMKQMKAAKGGEAIVVETMDAGGYTYIKMKENGNEFWGAVTQRPVETGKTYYYADGMLMKNFTSKQLDRTFDQILFIQSFSEQPIEGKTAGGMDNPHENTSSDKMQDINIEPAEGGIALAELFRNSEKYEGKEVTVRGKIAKINRNIMQKNWVHVQDGTEYEGQFDLTITTKEGEELKTGDIATFKGVIVLDKDFGSGYKYDILMEDANLTDFEGRKM